MADVKFKYKFPEDYNPVYINGAQGGISPRGEIIINFYLERSPIPYEESIVFDEGGVSVGRPVVTSPEDFSTNIIRYVSSGVVMSLEGARGVHEWLGRHIEHLEQLKHSDEEGDS